MYVMQVRQVEQCNVCECVCACCMLSTQYPGEVLLGGNHILCDADRMKIPLCQHTSGKCYFIFHIKN